MALVNKEAVAAAPSAPTTIVRQFTGSSVIYTVPQGRKFSGIMTATTSNNATINGVSVMVFNATAVPVEVLGGTVFSGGSTAMALVGIESDA